MSAPAKQTAGTAPVDTVTMRKTVARALGSEGETGAPPPAPKNLDILIGQLRGHLELLIPEVEQMLARLPKDGTARYCAGACVGEARGKLQARPAPRADGEVEYARRLARILRALLDHFEGNATPSS
ncbi:hypothetical protein GTY41_06170 [Streptomyces sp. SID685]|uniref:DUF6415 family natural product biosynthesis protein n=1 Tax=Streptomyces TaxID=1883 RepID=UPI00136C9792|nr:DUF6415 family natural product biosynthesis protein [Streptomyces sp. SID685]MYR84546.1 hypothetical protein [Streptomyces sp. SID685]